MTSMKDRIRELVDELADARRELDRLTDDGERPQRLGPPATPAQLARLETRLGGLPPSYRAFLELHDGWAEFDGEARILSSEDRDEAWVAEAVSRLVDAIVDAGFPNPFATGHPIVLGETEQNFVVMEPRTGGPGAERDIVAYDLSEEMARFPDFIGFLEYELALTREMIRREKKGRPE